MNRTILGVVLWNFKKSYFWSASPTTLLRLTTVFSHRDLCDQFNGAIIEIPIEEEIKEENPDS